MSGGIGHHAFLVRELSRLPFQTGAFPGLPTGEGSIPYAFVRNDRDIFCKGNWSTSHA